MAKDLVNNPEAKLGGAEKPYMDLGDHLEYIESILEQGAGGADGGIKTVSINIENMTWDTSQVDITKDKIIFVEQLGFVANLIQDSDSYYYYVSDSNIADGSLHVDMANLKLNSDGTVKLPVLSIGVYDDTIVFDTGGELNKGFLGCPELPTDASTKNYTLNSVNGTLTWNTIGNGLEIKDGALQATSGGGGGGQSIEDLPVVELTSEITTITDETVKAKILENVNNDNYLICKLKMPQLSTIEILITRDAKLVPNDIIENTVFTQIAFINLGLVASTFAFTLSINSKDGTIAVAYELFDYVKGNQISLFQKADGAFGVTTDYGDTNNINGLTFYFDTINGKPIIHSDTTVNSYNIPTITFED